MATKIQLAALTLITLVAVVFVMVRPGVDCDDPQVWGTETGVQACAINGGK